MTQVPNEVSQLIANSGNNFHAKVARWLHANEWHVVVSPYYMDQTQNKAREIDLIAEKLWPVRNSWGEQTDNLAVRLFIECKFVPTHSVFWFADKDQSSAKDLVCAGGPVVVCSSFDHLFAVDFYADSPPSPISENFQMEVRYAYIDQRSRQCDEYFLLDFVEFSQLEKFAQAVERDAMAAAYLAHLAS